MFNFPFSISKIAKQKNPIRCSIDTNPDYWSCLIIQLNFIWNYFIFYKRFSFHIRKLNLFSTSIYWFLFMHYQQKKFLEFFSFNWVLFILLSHIYDIFKHIESTIANIVNCSIDSSEFIQWARHTNTVTTNRKIFVSTITIYIFIYLN